MTKFLPIIALVAIILATSSAIEAKGKGSGGKGTPGGGIAKGNHNSAHWAHSYPHGYNYWSGRYWSSRYGCEFCYSAVDGCYYYYYAPAYCYYPITYIAQYPPVAVGPPTAPAAPVMPVASAPLPPPGPPVGPLVNFQVNAGVGGPPSIAQAPRP